MANDSEQRIAKLKGQIKALEDADPESKKLPGLRSELAELEAGSGDAVVASGEGLMELPDVDKDTYDEAGSQFVAEAGVYKVELGRPYWKTPGKSIGFPFTITDDLEKGKQGEIFAGTDKKAVWKVKETLKAVGAAYSVIKETGNVAFNPDDVAGKPARVLFEMQRDTRSAEEGGTGKLYAKATTVYPLVSKAS